MAKRTRAYLSWTPANGSKETLQFDVVTDETQEGESDVTEHAVEQGPDVSDNVRPKLVGVTLEAFVSNEPLYDINERGASMRSVDLDVKEFTPAFAPTPGALFSAIGGGISRLFGSGKPVTQAYVLQFDREFDAVSDTYEKLEKLRSDAQIIDLFTTTSEYRNVILQRLSLKRNAGTGSGGSFSMTFKQLRLVEVKTVTAPVPTEQRAKKAVKKGPQGPEPVKDPGPKKSLAKALFGDVFKS